ncbi:unnamed protein product [Soboliphyme baturini]|uniref:Ig-like domain-containing protein n=1 Tax=Soboliphyme baturini TaxID=241478 RepID=A0A183IK42_9BILA|nr:unnamed protein product [Soboliphyme baturini]
MTIVPLFNIGLTVSHQKNIFLNHQTCKWIEFPVVISRATRLSMVLLMAIILNRRIYTPLTTTANANTVFNTCTVFIWLLSVAMSCFCNYILSGSTLSMVTLWSVRLFMLVLAIGMFLHVYFSSQTKALDLSINTVQASLPERMRLWSNISYVKNILPWAIMHCLWMTLTAVVSFTIFYYNTKMRWPVRIILAVSASLMHALDLFVQPIMLIRASYSLRCKIYKCHPIIRSMFIGCVIPKNSITTVANGVPMGLPHFKGPASRTHSCPSGSVVTARSSAAFLSLPPTIHSREVSDDNGRSVLKVIRSNRKTSETLTGSFQNELGFALQRWVVDGDGGTRQRLINPPMTFVVPSGSAFPETAQTAMGLSLHLDETPSLTDFRQIDLWHQLCGWQNNRGTAGNSMAKTEIDVMYTVCEIDLTNPYDRVYTLYRDITKWHQAPKLVRQPDDQIHFGGENTGWTQFSCRAKGRPAPTYAWFRDSIGKEIDPLQEENVIKIGGELLLTNLSSKDYGTYYCMAQNAYGSIISARSQLIEAFIEPFATSRLDVYAIENMGKAVACQSPSYFPSDVQYAWKRGVPDHFLQESQRIFFGRDGTLYFSHFLRDDEDYYSCNLIMPLMQTGRYGPPFRLRAKRSFETTAFFKPVIPPEMPHIWPQNPTFHGQAILECFAFGRVLMIKSIAYQDVGNYTCESKNSQGKAVKTVALKVYAAPKIFQITPDTYRYVGDRVTFKCEAVGNPPVEYEWFHDGKPVSPLLLTYDEARRISPRGNRLTLSPLRKADSGVYQCIVTNSLGQDTASTQLSVGTVPSNMQDVHQDPVIYAIVGENLKIKCIAFASMLNSCLWRHEDKIITLPEATKIQPNCELYITYLRTHNSGHYSCEASNGYELIKRRFLVKVLDFFNISVYSIRHSVNVREKATLHCRLSEVANLETPVWWTFNDREISSLDQFRNIEMSYRSHQQTLIISNVTISHGGSYRCHTSFRSADVVSNPFILKKQRLHPKAITDSCTPNRVETRSISDSPQNAHCSRLYLGQKNFSHRQRLMTVGEPPMPSHVAVDRESYYLRVYWRMPPAREDTTVTVTVFRLECRNLTNGQWVILSEHIPSSINEVRLSDGMSPYTWYSFRVFAKNDFGWSAASLATAWIRTNPGGPKFPVSRLSTDVAGPGEMNIIWQPISKEFWGSDQLGYLIEWSLANSTEEGHEIQLGLSDHWPVDSCAVQANVPRGCATYQVSYCLKMVPY